MKCRYCKKEVELKPCRQCLRNENNRLEEDLAIMTGNYQTYVKLYNALLTDNKQLKAWQKIMQNEVDTAHDDEIELLTLREFIKWGEREEVYKVWLEQQMVNGQIKGLDKVRGEVKWL